MPASYLLPYFPRNKVPTYYIPNHVHFCIEGDAVVFLDLRSDQYRMLLGRKACAFVNLLSRTSDSIDRKISCSALNSQADMDLDRALISELLHAHILTIHGASDAPPMPANIPFPEIHLMESAHEFSRKLRLSDIWRFVLSSVVARWTLKRKGLEKTIHIIQQRRRHQCIDHPLDIAAARRYVCIYNTLRHLCTNTQKCLLDSISLIEFLARYNCYPGIVFAVQLEPWGAHCWVQYGSIAFNQDIDEARTYLPVMLI